ncbi:MAG: hypothetical protein IPK76_13010 [Lewinellaceae bacterium]|nr:hypothetical protein [Lewinellaceae bacterium]
MQNLLYNHPTILPVQEIEPGFAPLISIGREISTAVGNMDNLFISPEGYLTIVEAKLWRNPEARREVVGQILDYAKDMAKWSYTDLDNRVKVFNQFWNNTSDGLVETGKKRFDRDEAEEDNFIDKGSRNLRRGRFLLLIVGDGIRESLEEMVDYLSQTPQLYFTLALIELQVFQLGNDTNTRLIIPQLVTRTKEITRAIIRLEGTQPDGINIRIEADLDSADSRRLSLTSRRMTITAEDFFEQLRKNTDQDTVVFAQRFIKDCEALGLETTWNSSSFGIKLPDPLGSGLRIGIFNVDRTGYIYPGYSQGQLEKLQIPVELSYEFAAQTAALIPGVGQNPKQKNTWNKYLTLHDFQKGYDQILKIVEDYVNQIKKHSQSNSE